MHLGTFHPQNWHTFLLPSVCSMENIFLFPVTSPITSPITSSKMTYRTWPVIRISHPLLHFHVLQTELGPIHGLAVWPSLVWHLHRCSAGAAMRHALPSPASSAWLPTCWLQHTSLFCLLYTIVHRPAVPQPSLPCPLLGVDDHAGKAEDGNMLQPVSDHVEGARKRSTQQASSKLQTLVHAHLWLWFSTRNEFMGNVNGGSNLKLNSYVCA